jgi:hypothetical protein
VGSEEVTKPISEKPSVASSYIAQAFIISAVYVHWHIHQPTSYSISIDTVSTERETGTEILNTFENRTSTSLFPTLSHAIFEPDIRQRSNRATSRNSLFQWPRKH